MLSFVIICRWNLQKYFRFELLARWVLGNSGLGVLAGCLLGTTLLWRFSKRRAGHGVQVCENFGLDVAGYSVSEPSLCWHAYIYIQKITHYRPQFSVGRTYTSFVPLSISSFICLVRRHDL